MFRVHSHFPITLIFGKCPPSTAIFRQLHLLIIFGKGLTLNKIEMIIIYYHTWPFLLRVDYDEIHYAVEISQYMTQSFVNIKIYLNDYV